MCLNFYPQLDLRDNPWKEHLTGIVTEEARYVREYFVDLMKKRDLKKVRKERNMGKAADCVYLLRRVGLSWCDIFTKEKGGRSFLSRLQLTN